MIPTLFVLRHGTTPEDEPGQKTTSGWNGIALDKNGIRHAHQAASFLSDFPIHHVLHSDLNRAAQTAAIVSTTLRVPSTPDFALRPWNLGQLVGQPEEQTKQKIEEYINKPSLPVPSGESYNEFYTRWSGRLSQVLFELHQHREPVLLITHSHNVYALKNIMTNGWAPIEGSVAPGSVVGIRFQGPKFDYALLFEGQ